MQRLDKYPLSAVPKRGRNNLNRGNWKHPGFLIKKTHIKIGLEKKENTLIVIVQSTWEQPDILGCSCESTVCFPIA